MLFQISLIQFHHLGFHGKAAAFIHGILGIDRQIHDDLFDLADVRQNRLNMGAWNERDVDIFPNGIPQKLLEVCHGFVDINGGVFQGLLSTECQQLTYQIPCPKPRFDNFRQGFMRWMIRFTVFQQQLTESEDGGEEVVQIMAHTAGQPADGLHFL